MSAPLPIDPIQDPAAWDAVELAGVEWPYCEVSGFVRENGWDVKKGKGAYGSTLTFVGLEPVKGSVKFYAWESKHFTDFGQILQLLKYDPAKKTPQAVEIYHPALVEVEVTQVVATKIPPWNHDGEGMYTREIEFIEYRPAPKTSAVATPSNAATSDPNKSPSSGLQPDPAIKAANDEFNKALSDAKNLGPP